jgi:hypothetical protein
MARPKGPSKQKIYLLNRIGSSIPPEEAEILRRFITANQNKDQMFWLKALELVNLMNKQLGLTKEKNVVTVVDAESGFQYKAHVSEVPDLMAMGARVTVQAPTRDEL